MLHSSKTKDFAELNEVGAALTESNVAGLFHVGVLYRNEEEDVKLLHLTMEKVLNGVSSEKYRWVQCGLNQATLDVLCSFCIVVASKIDGGMKVPYGFRYNGSYFKPDGTFIEGSGQGLTCSTFIMALFRTMRVELLDVKKWPKPSNVDSKFQTAAIMNAMMQYQDIVEDLIDQQGSPRYRPEHVVAAVHENKVPIQHSKAEKLAQTIVAEFAALRGE